MIYRILDGAIWAIRENLLTRGDKSNRIYTNDFLINEGEINTDYEHLIYDPQTSGGLLISVNESKAIKLLNSIKDSGDEIANIVGFVTSPNEFIKPGTILFKY